MAEVEQLGYRLVATVKAVKGTCEAGHKVGDEIALSGLSSGGLCGYLYHDIFPYIVMLEYGGGFPAEWGNPEEIEFDCVDKENAVTVLLRRVRD
ncbi:MAG: TIGR04076 family protein [Actinomycetota bacterium]